MFKLLQSVWVSAAAALVIIIFSVLIFRLGLPILRVNKEMDAVEVRISEAEKKFSELENSAGLFEDAGYIEKLARLRLNYKKPGEKVVYVYKKEAENTEENVRLSKPIGDKIWDWLTGFFRP